MEHKINRDDLIPQRGAQVDSRTLRVRLVYDAVYKVLTHVKGFHPLSYEWEWGLRSLHDSAIADEKWDLAQDLYDLHYILGISIDGRKRKKK